MDSALQAILLQHNKHIYIYNMYMCKQMYVCVSVSLCLCIYGLTARMGPGLVLQGDGFFLRPNMGYFAQCLQVSQFVLELLRYLLTAFIGRSECCRAFPHWL